MYRGQESGHNSQLTKLVSGFNGTGTQLHTMKIRTVPETRSLTVTETPGDSKLARSSSIWATSLTLRAAQLVGEDAALELESLLHIVAIGEGGER